VGESSSKKAKRSSIPSVIHNLRMSASRPPVAAAPLFDYTEPY